MSADVADDRSFQRGDPVCAYWLAHCERFTVRSGRRAGSVERIELDEARRPLALTVRYGFRRSVIPAAEVQAVVPAKRLVVLEPTSEPRISPALALATASGRAVSTGRSAALAVGRATWAAAAAIAVALAVVAQVVYARGRIAVATLRARSAEAIGRRHPAPRRSQRRMQPR